MDRIEPSQQPERASYHLFSAPAGETDDSERKRAWKGDAFSFRDVLDIINPLQHLPVISTLYRWITGDTIGAVPRMVGDGLYGGPIGFVAGLFNAAIKQESGKDVGEQVIALLGVDQSSPAADPIAVAAKDAPQGGGPQVTATATGDGASPLAPAGVPIAGVPIAGIPIAGAAAAGAMPGPGQPIVATAAILECGGPRSGGPRSNSPGHPRRHPRSTGFAGGGCRSAGCLSCPHQRAPPPARRR